ncbi:Mannose-1-phosphate guanyltransferase alpha-A [Nymphon striatum]|nr:Mannose-1-phosphate guanyltransferase alpha-A [Nymphon striatum]
MLKAVILIGGPQKGTRFRPLSLDVPKPLFPVAGSPMIQHHIEACSKISEVKEILIIGFYQANDDINQFISAMISEYKMSIRYLQEYNPLGTAGGIYHFRDQIKSGNPDAFFLLNGDVCGDFPLQEMLEFHKSHSSRCKITVLATEATSYQAMNYGCIVENKETHEVMHYVEKPSSFISNLINCGVYVCSLDIFGHVSQIFTEKQHEYYSMDFNEADISNKDAIMLERDILMPFAGTNRLFVYQTNRWWSQIKTAASAIYANRHYLSLYKQHHPERLAKFGGNQATIIGDVYIHPTASVHPTATLGPNVSIGKGASVGPGVRIRESIVLGAATIQDHSCILHTIVGWNSTIGSWSRVEGTPCDPNPNKPFTKMDNAPLFNDDGKLNPSITILGSYKRYLHPDFVAAGVIQVGVTDQ